jgi:type II secretory pathway pseudopilin PulG
VLAPSKHLATDPRRPPFQAGGGGWAKERFVGSRAGSERGITIVEMTVVLSVLFILAGALTPIVSESIDTARLVRAANDAKMIAAAMVDFENDLGSSALVRTARMRVGARLNPAFSQAVMPDVLVTGGEVPQVEGDETASASRVDLPAELGLSVPVQAESLRSTRATRRRWLDAATGLIEDHLIANNAGYSLKRPDDDGGGWNGPYLSKAVKADPWGKRYQINTVGFDGGVTAADANGNPRRAVFVVSAGGNGIIETPFDQPISDAKLFGDDIGIRIQ